MEERRGRRKVFERDRARRFFLELDRSHGACWLRRSDVSGIVAGALAFHDGIKVRCGDFVIMPNHVQWIVLPMEGHALENVLWSVKDWTARRMNEVLNRSGAVWQKESFDRIVRNGPELDRTRAYIEANPVNAWLHAGNFRYFRADWL